MEGECDDIRLLRYRIVFNPPPPHGGRLSGSTGMTSRPAFQSTPSAWRETLSLLVRPFASLFQSTPSAWRETIMYFVSKMEKLISIHSLRMEGDHIFESVLCEISNFNPLPPHGGRPYGSRVIQCPLNFNPLPPHGGRRKTTCGMSTQAAFQSTPSAWRETSTYKHTAEQSGISIHSLRMEGDLRREKL